MSRSHSILLSIASVLLFGLFSVGLVSAETNSSVISRYLTGISVSDIDTYALEITNVNTQSVNVVLTFSDLAGTVQFNHFQEVAPMATELITANAFLPLGFLGSVAVSADREIMAQGIYSSGGGEVTIQSFEEGSSMLHVPNIFQNDDFYSVLYVNNASTSAQTVTVGMLGSSCSETHQLASGGALYLSQLSDMCTPEGFSGSAIIEVSGGRGAGELIATSYMFTRSGNVLAGGSNGSSTPLAVNLASMNMSDPIASPSIIVSVGFSLLMGLTAVRAYAVLRHSQ